jgi:hypothetical protein
MDLTPSNREQRLNKLRTELVRRGLPRAYIERLLSELDDHFTDLVEERNSPMGAARKLQFESDDPQQRLGEPKQLAVFAADQYHSRTFWGRHPILTFLIGPLPLLATMWCAYLVLIWLVFALPAAIGHWLTGWSVAVENYPYLQAIGLTLFTWGLFVVPPLASALLFCRAYRRNALRIRWPVIGCVLLALIVAHLQYSWRIKTGSSPTELGTFMVGFIWGTNFLWYLVAFLPRFATALGIGLLLIKRAQQQLERESYSDNETRHAA